MKKSALDCKYLFIRPPSLIHLEDRLIGRNTETAEKIKVRLEAAATELAFSEIEGNFDAIIVNDDLEKTFLELVAILQSWFPELDLYLG